MVVESNLFFTDNIVAFAQTKRTTASAADCDIHKDGRRHFRNNKFSAVAFIGIRGAYDYFKSYAVVDFLPVNFQRKFRISRTLSISPTVEL